MLELGDRSHKMQTGCISFLPPAHAVQALLWDKLSSAHTTLGGSDVPMCHRVGNDCRVFGCISGWFIVFTPPIPQAIN